MAHAFVPVGHGIDPLRPRGWREAADDAADAPFATTPDVVGAAVAEAVRKGREAIHVPRLLGPVFAGFRLLPRSVFRKLPG